MDGRIKEGSPLEERLDIATRWQLIGDELSIKRTKALEELEQSHPLKPLTSYKREELTPLTREDRLRLLIEVFDPKKEKIPDLLTLAENTAKLLVDLAIDHAQEPEALETTLQKHSLPELIGYCAVQREIHKTGNDWFASYLFYRVVGIARKMMTKTQLMEILDSPDLAELIRHQQPTHQAGNELPFLMSWGIVNPAVENSYLREVLPKKPIALLDREGLISMGMMEKLFSRDDDKEMQAMETLYYLRKTSKDRFFEQTSLQHDIAPFLDYITRVPPEERGSYLAHLGRYIQTNKIAPPPEQRVRLIDSLLATKPEEKGRYVTFIRQTDFWISIEPAAECLEVITNAWPAFTPRFVEPETQQDLAYSFTIDREKYQEFIEEQERRAEQAKARLEKIICKSCKSGKSGRNRGRFVRGKQ